MIEFRKRVNYERVRRAVTVPAIDFILETPTGAVLYVVRAVEPEKGMASLPGTTFRKPRAGEFATMESMMDYILRTELAIGLDDLATKPLRLPGELAWFESSPSYHTEGIDVLLRTSDDGPIESGEVAFSEPAIAIIDERGISKLQPNQDRYSRLTFRRTPPKDLLLLYRKHLELYRRLGSYDTIAKLFG